MTFTRGRTGKKDDQCFVEQTNGSIVRQLVGYDRFEGEAAYRQLAELYRAVRLYVNFFQPSMKLATKRPEGGAVRRTDAPAKTPFRRLVESGALDAAVEARLTALVRALDPVQLLRQLQQLQDALWRHAVFRTPTLRPPGGSDVQELRRFMAERQQAANAAGPESARARKYRRTEQSPGPRCQRIRADPFADVWEEVVAWLEAEPTRTGTSAFAELQRRYPGQFVDGRCRTLHRRVREWRVRRVLAFDDEWLAEGALSAARLPRPLAMVGGDPALEPALAAGG